MKYIKGRDFVADFKLAIKVGKPATLVFTSNTTITKRGGVVMGRGAALAVKNSFNNIDKLHAKALKELRTSTTVKDIYNNKVSIKEAKITTAYQKGDHAIMAFPVKYGWWEDADIKLITINIKALAKIAKKNPDMNYLLNFPGIGAGRLYKYKGVIKKTLDEQFKDLKNIFVYTK